MGCALGGALSSGTELDALPLHPPGHPGAAQIQPAEPYLVRPKNTLSATSKTPAVPPPLYDFCFRTREVCFAAHKPCSQAGVCKRVRRDSSSCLEPEFLRLVLCDFSLRPVWTCPRTKVAPRLSCSARTEPPGDKLDFGRKSCVTLPHSFSWPPSRQPRRCTYTEK